MNFLQHYLNFNYFFSLRPQAMSSRGLIVLGTIFAAFVALAVISKIMSLKIKDGLKVKAWQRFFHVFLTMGILGLVYLFFAFEGAALLASRFWLIIMFVTAVVWLAFIVKYLLFDVPKLRKKINYERDFKRYIP